MTTRPPRQITRAATAKVDNLEARSAALTAAEAAENGPDKVTGEDAEAREIRASSKAVTQVASYVACRHGGPWPVDGAETRVQRRRSRWPRDRSRCGCLLRRVRGPYDNRRRTPPRVKPEFGGLTAFSVTRSPCSSVIQFPTAVSAVACPRIR